MVIFNLTRRIFEIYSFLLIISAILSWFPNAQNTPIYKIVHKLTDPYMDIFDQYIPSIGGISFNVIIAIFVLNYIEIGVNTILRLLLF